MSYFVNGHEVKVGQVWCTRGGEEVTITHLADVEFHYPIEGEDSHEDYVSYTRDGLNYEGEESDIDLISLLKDTAELSEEPVSEVLKQPEIGQKHDQGKLRPTLLFQSLPNAVHQTIEVLQYGANKYGDENWKQVDPKRYKDALLRHLLAYLAGEEHDKESDLKHLAHISSNVLFLLEHEAMQDKEKN